MEGGKKAVLSITLVMAAAALALTFVLGGCGGGVSGTVTASGSTTVQPLAQAAAEQFMEENSGATVTIQGGGSSTGITQVSEGSVDIGDSSRDLKPEEEGKGLVDNKIAYDIIAMIVNPDVTVDNLTADQAKGIFVGTIKNWSEVGGPNEEIVVVIRDEASGTREMFDEKVLGSKKDAPVKSVSGAQEAGSNGIMRQKVASTPNAIGYVSYGYLDKTVNALELDGVKPTLENALNKTYPLGRYLHMFTRGEPTETTKAYIDFVLSDTFQTDVVSKEYIPIAETDSSTR